jgi:predicted DNA-binding transcriptional regulator AlpA
MPVPSPDRQRFLSGESEQRPLLMGDAPARPALTEPQNFDLPDRLIGKRALTALLGCSYTTVWKWCVQGKFVKAIDCNGIPRWRLSEVMDWIETRERRRFKGDSRLDV